jgi:hypothetical protein
MTVTNYPDVLGAITGGQRIVIGTLQTALALRPRIPRSGRPFEVILLLQNTADVPMDVLAMLKLPETDAKKQTGKFIARDARLRIGLHAAEVGVVTLPAVALPDTAPSDIYRLAVEIETKPLEKAGRIRANDGGGTFDAASLPPENREMIESLSSLKYTGEKKTGRPILEAPLPLMSGGSASLPMLKPRYIPLWRMGMYEDARPLLHYYGDLLLTVVFPKLRRNELYQPLYRATQERFHKAGFDLYEPEIALITKLMLLIIEYAAPVERAHGFMAAREFAIAPMLKNNPLDISEPPKLPRYLWGLLRLIERDRSTAEQPIPALTTALYDDLLYDSGCFGFDLVERETGEDLGSPAEIEHYMGDLIDMIRGGDGLDFSRVYLPLILGGLIINEQIPASKESPSELLKSLTRIVSQRSVHLTDDALPLLDMTNHLIERMGQKYGFRSGV